MFYSNKWLKIIFASTRSTIPIIAEPVRGSFFFFSGYKSVQDVFFNDKMNRSTSNNLRNIDLVHLKVQLLKLRVGTEGSSDSLMF